MKNNAETRRNIKKRHENTLPETGNTKRNSKGRLRRTHKAFQKQNNKRHETRLQGRRRTKRHSKEETRKNTEETFGKS